MIDISSGDVGREKIRRELHAVEGSLHAFCELLDGAGLGESGRSLDDYMAVRKKGEHQPVDQIGLADNSLSQELPDILNLFSVHLVSGKFPSERHRWMPLNDISVKKHRRRGCAAVPAPLRQRPGLFGLVPAGSSDFGGFWKWYQHT